MDHTPEKPVGRTFTDAFSREKRQIGCTDTGIKQCCGLVDGTGWLALLLALQRASIKNCRPSFEISGSILPFRLCFNITAGSPRPPSGSRPSGQHQQRISCFSELAQDRRI
jgi:hypothetical protein